MTPVNWFILQLLIMVVFWVEELTVVTILTVIAVSIVRARGIKVHRWALQAVGASLFAFAFLKFGRLISPEMGLNILLGVVAVKLAEAKEGRDWRIVTLGIFLLWSSGALFVKTPWYFICAITGVFVSLAALIRLLDEPVSLSWRDILRWVLRAVPLALALFFFLPRFNANVWSPPAPPNRGEIGYTEDARPGDAESIVPTGALAFQVAISRPIELSSLYWRGTTLSEQDGWNWSMHPIDNTWVQFSPAGSVPGQNWISQELIHKKNVSQAFALDWGQWLLHNGQEAAVGSNGTWRFPTFRQLRRYVVWSDPLSEQATPPPSEMRTWQRAPDLRQHPVFGAWAELSLEQKIASMESYFSRDFQYTLSPGRVPSFEDFLVRRQGWCVHYASAAGLILRGLGHPTRLVSGYLGGEFNAQGNYWTVSEDDAHVWVEVWNGEAWQRVDPTLWVAPTRNQFSGGEFLRRQQGSSSWSSYTPTWVRDTQQWIASVNFRFLIWSEEFDRESQKEWAEKFKWELSSFYMAGVWVLGLAMLLWWLHDWWIHRSPRANELHRLWMDWRHWLAKRGVMLPHQAGAAESREALQRLDVKVREDGLAWLKDWEEAVYATEIPDPIRLRELRRRLRL